MENTIPTTALLPTAASYLPIRKEGSLTTYKGEVFPVPLQEALPAIESFEADESDVVLCTVHRSGSTLTSSIVTMIQNDADPTILYKVSLEEHVPLVEFCQTGMIEGQRIIDVIKRMPPPRTFYTHVKFSLLSESTQEKAKVICVVRNPKDVIVSVTHYIRMVPGCQFADGTVEEMAEMFMADKTWWVPYFDIVADSWKNRHKPNVFFMTYEELAKDFKGTVKRLGAFMGKDLNGQQLENIATHCRFDAMKNNNNTNRKAQEKVGVFDFGVSPFIRVGKVGGWKKHFSVALNEKVDRWIEKEFKRLKDDLDGFKFEYE